MRKIIIFVAGVAVCAPAYIFATYFGSIVSSFPSPSAQPSGVACHAGEIYIQTADYTQVLWRTTRTGSVIQYHPLFLKTPRDVTVGTVAGNTFYWVVDDIREHVFKFRGGSSTVLGSFPIPAGYPWGVAFVDKTHMYYTDVYGQKLYYLNPATGSIYSSYDVGFYAGPLAYDPAGYLWIVGFPDTVNECTLSGSVLRSFSVYRYAYDYARGCGYDGEYVWIAATRNATRTYTIMQINVREEPGVEPASWGKVKAVFR